MALSRVKYCNTEWTVSEGQGGFLLSAPVKTRTGFEDRTLLATVGGVFECKRDGSGEPVTLMDCSPALFERIAQG